MTTRREFPAALGIAARSNAVDQDEVTMQRFLKWLADHGATFSSTLRVDAGSRHMYTTKAFVQGELLMHIPKRLLLTLDVVKESETGKLLHQHGCRLGRFEYIAVFLLREKREGGFWKPYIDILPTDFSGHPLLFSEAELEQLKGSHLFRLVREAQSFNQTCYRQLPPTVKEAYTLTEFTWARCVVMTRAFGIKFDGAPSAGLVPLADMADHALDNTGRWVFESDNGFSITAQRPLDAGAALLNSYGAKSNAHFLINYGFCLEGNPKNEVETLLPPLHDGHPFARHTNMYGEPVAGMRAFRLRRSCIDGPATAILSYLRLTHADASLRSDNSEVNLYRSSKVPPVSRDNEIAVLNTLAEACARHLREYATAIGEDDALLRNPALPRNVRHMVMVRRDEKSILNYFIELTRLALPTLRDETSAIGDQAAADGDYSGYFAEIARLFERERHGQPGPRRKRDPADGHHEALL
jgi:histone-lysine N-methyltransferase SETD3